VLRTALVAVSGGLLFDAMLLASLGCTLGTVLHFAVPGSILLFALLVEHWQYKPLSTARPGGDWVPTDERFADPASGRLVTVFYNPSTGERRYVAG
jgi:hypothetical protein